MIYTFPAQSITLGTVSIEADTYAKALQMAEMLKETQRAVMNTEIESGEVQVFTEGHPQTQDPNADDGNHYWSTPRANAAENAEAWEAMEEEDGAACAASIATEEGDRYCEALAREGSEYCNQHQYLTA